MTVTYNGKRYQVGYTRAAAQDAENAGFDVNKISSKPNVMIPLLVYYAFRTHNRKIKRQLVEEIYDQIPNREDFVSALVEQYADTVNTLMEDSDEGNAAWTMD